jgi:hypothetical protein
MSADYWYLLACGLLAVCSTFLVLHCKYEDGFFGRISLAVIACIEGFTIWEWWIDDVIPQVLPSTYWKELAFALFFARHVYRFMMWRLYGDHEWTEVRK